MALSETIGKFEVLESLGQGAGSTILKIRRQSDAKVYALKVIAVQSAEDKKYVTQAEREYEIGSSLNHRNLVKVYAFETIRRLFSVTGARLLLEYVEGTPLVKCSDLPVVKLTAIFVQVAAGLSYLHKKGVYHADMKPDNIMVGPKGDVKVIDYGLAWRADEKKDRVQGTLEFLAPEQANDKTVNSKTDIFNLGATMYRVFTGRPIPSQLREKNAIKRADELARPVCQTNPQVPEALDELIRECIRVQPDERPRIMKEVRDRLAAIARAMGAGQRRRMKDET